MVVNIPGAKLREMVRLSQRKEALMAQIQEIDRKMLRLEREFDRAPGANSRKARLTFSTTPTTETGTRSRQSRRRPHQVKARPLR